MARASSACCRQCFGSLKRPAIIVTPTLHSLQRNVYVLWLVPTATGATIRTSAPCRTPDRACSAAGTKASPPKAKPIG
jgi:hypothetical protein